MPAAATAAAATAAAAAAVAAPVACATAAARAAAIAAGCFWCECTGSFQRNKLGAVCAPVLQCKSDLSTMCEVKARPAQLHCQLPIKHATSKTAHKAALMVTVEDASQHFDESVLIDNSVQLCSVPTHQDHGVTVGCAGDPGANAAGGTVAWGIELQPMAACAPLQHALQQKRDNIFVLQAKQLQHNQPVLASSVVLQHVKAE